MRPHVLALLPVLALAGLASVSCKVDQPNLTDPPKRDPATPANTGNTGGTPLAADDHAAPSNPAALLDPSQAKEQAPATYSAKFTTSKGTFTVKVTRASSPNGADRFYNMVKIGYFNGCRFFRAVPNFMVQFGINGDPAVNEKWRPASIPDDPVVQGNKRGFVTFAKTSLPNSRTTQIFINYGDNSNLDGMGFASFGEVVDGMSVVDSLYQGYGDAPEMGGHGPNQGLAQSQGNAYLAKDFPQLDWIKDAVILP